MTLSVVAISRSRLPSGTLRLIVVQRLKSCAAGRTYPIRILANARIGLTLLTIIQDLRTAILSLAL